MPKGMPVPQSPIIIEMGGELIDLGGVSNGSHYLRAIMSSLATAWPASDLLMSEIIWIMIAAASRLSLSVTMAVVPVVGLLGACEAVSWCSSSCYFSRDMSFTTQREPCKTFYSPNTQSPRGYGRSTASDLSSQQQAITKIVAVEVPPWFYSLVIHQDYPYCTQHGVW